MSRERIHFRLYQHGRRNERRHTPQTPFHILVPLKLPCSCSRCHCRCGFYCGFRRNVAFLVAPISRGHELGNARDVLVLPKKQRHVLRKSVRLCGYWLARRPNHRHAGRTARGITKRGATCSSCTLPWSHVGVSTGTGTLELVITTTVVAVAAIISTAVLSASADTVVAVSAFI